MKLKNSLLFFFSISFLVTIAQSSFYYNLNSENDFPFNQIYNITESNQGYILICTESGVYEFDGLEHRKIKWENDLKDEILNFEKDAAGNIYGTGLKNNIYKVEDNAISLALEWSDSSQSYIRYFIDDDKIFLPSTSANIRYKDLTKNELSQISLDIKIEKNQTIQPLIIFDNQLHFKLLGVNSQSLNTYDFSTKRTKTVSYQGQVTAGYYFKLGNKLYFNSEDLKGEIDHLYQFDETSATFVEIESIYERDIRRFRTYVKDNTLFMMGRNGLEIYNLDLKLTLTLLPKIHITGVVAKGNSLWISTLNNGLYFIPNYHTKLYNEENSKLNSNHLDKLMVYKNHVIFAENKGSSWYLVEGDKPVLFSKQQDQVLSAFRYSRAAQSFFYGTKNKVYQFKVNGSIQLIDSFPTNGNKDVDRLGNYVVSANTSNSFFGVLNNDTSLLNSFVPYDIWSKSKRIQVDNLSNYILSYSRCFKAFINPIDSSTWFADGNGLIRLDRTSKEQISYEGKTLLINDVKLDSTGAVWIVTEDKLFQYKDKKIVRFFVPFSGFSNLFINSIEVYTNQILFSTNQGVFSYSTSNLHLKRWTKNDGLPTLNITKAALGADRLYAISNKGLSVITITDSIIDVHNEVFIRTVNVNSNSISIDSIHSFSYDNNNLTIELGALDIRSFKDRTYYYRLSGAHSDWVSSVNNAIIRYPNLAPGAYQFEVYVAAFNGQKSAVKSFDFEIRLPFWRTWWFISLIVIAVAISFYIYLTIRIKRINREKELKTKIIQSEIDGLKSQMNPHFIFNALNSIQNLIIKKDVSQSNLYLGKFADLLRSVLQYSTREKISLREEIELLRVYLDLEQLRFRDKLQTQITCEDDLHQFQIPPLLLQPHVENSLKHGLLHSTKEAKTLTLHFYKEDGYVICTIVDNGVGREASGKINERRAKYHESFATSSLEKRINLINRTTEKQMKIETFDLEDGTMVKVSFPI